jgi:tetratricopeptide (TPR) repeat protein
MPTPNSVGIEFQAALTLHQMGDLAEARALYEKILRKQPNHFDALHLLGVIFCQTRQLQRAVELIDKAIRINPNIAAFYSNRGNALQDLKQFDAAVASYDKAIQLKPDHAEAYSNRGNALQGLKQFDAAVASYDKAIQLKPGYAEAYSNRGLALQDLKQFDAAVASYDKAIQLKPGYAEAYCNRGIALQGLKQFDGAIASYDKAIQLKPDYAEAYCNRGIALQGLKQFDAAVASYDKAIQLKPGYAEPYFNRGLALQGLKQFDAAVASYDKAIQLKPDYSEAYSNRGLALQGLKQFDAAIASYDKAIQLKPGFAKAYWNKSLVLLLLGEFDRGWKIYEWRWKKDDLNLENRDFTRPLWIGIEPLKNKTILIHAEQGLGDTIQFCRYVKSITALSEKVIFEVQPALVPLMKGLNLSLDILARGATLPDFDYHCPLLSLPLAFQNIGNAAISTESYIKADQRSIEKWRNYFNNEQFNIGINWQGNSHAKVDIGRSFPLALFERIASSSKVKLFSLQKNEGTEQLNVLPKGMVIESFGEQVDSEGAFLDTAAIMKNLDLIITSDTAVAHLAGALGCRVWLALKWVPDWRWMLDTNSSSWYPSMRLFRQKKADDWKGVFDEIESELNLLVQKKWIER